MVIENAAAAVTEDEQRATVEPSAAVRAKFTATARTPRRNTSDAHTLAPKSIHEQ